MKASQTPAVLYDSCSYAAARPDPAACAAVLLHAWCSQNIRLIHGLLYTEDNIPVQFLKSKTQAGIEAGEEANKHKFSTTMTSLWIADVHAPTHADVHPAKKLNIKDVTGVLMKIEGLETRAIADMLEIVLKYDPYEAVMTPSSKKWKAKAHSKTWMAATSRTNAEILVYIQVRHAQALPLPLPLPVHCLPLHFHNASSSFALCRCGLHACRCNGAQRSPTRAATGARCVPSWRK